jgi:uncharacterized membrane protein
MKSQNAFKVFSAVFALVFLVSVASAAVLSTSNEEIPSSVAHNAGSFDIKFDLTNTGVADSEVSFTLEMTSGTATLNMPSISVSDGTTTPQVIEDLTAVINFPAGQNGNLVGKIVIDDSGAAQARELPFNVPIDNSPSLSLTEVTAVTEGGNGLIRLENEGNVDFSSVTLSAEGDFTVDFVDPATDNVISALSLDAGESKDIRVEPVDLGEVGFGGRSITVTAASGATQDTLEMSVEGSFCEAGEKGGNLKISDVKIDNRGTGKDDEWNLLDTIEVEVQVDNDGNDDVKDVFVELGFFDSDGNNQVNDLDFAESDSDDEEYDVGRINDGKDETVTFKFKVPADFDDGSYKLTVKAYSDDLGEDVECTDTASDLSDDNFESISVDRESDSGKFIAFDDVQFIPGEVTCGERVSMTFDVYNIGDEDQDQVKVNLRNTPLKLDESVEIRSDLDQGDSETINFDFVIPDGVTDGLYDLRLTADYDYKNGNYRDNSDDETLFQLRLLGCGVGPGTPSERVAVISFNLESDAMAGEELVVRTTVTSTKTTSDQFTISADGYDSWASLDDVSPTAFNLASGESRDITLTFMLDEDAEGTESFEIEVMDSAGNVETRSVVIENIGGATGGAGAGFDFGDNTFLWIVGLVNVILVVLIIIVAVRVARR